MKESITDADVEKGMDFVKNMFQKHFRGKGSAPAPIHFDLSGIPWPSSESDKIRGKAIDKYNELRNEGAMVWLV